ncbi:transglutaminase family protein [Chondromyces apiculatus]|uniref:Transglutaminase-like domain-containing protein n=1 Tax=Chondromyces apiculatus DSM 436 TaxID=1192034 RepID=A0A017TGC4_9BACT|nr:transglutaminaseTgpA domain-containing protein [Chondromyces apiculatus]EYF08348.1 Hypothetical protein CAP_4964 [Chondromyces apiculatus DSM 436]
MSREVAQERGGREAAAAPELRPGSAGEAHAGMRTARRLMAAALLVVARVMMMGEAPVAAGIAALVVAVGLGLGPRFAPGALGQRVLLVVLAASGAAMAMQVPLPAGPGGLGRFWTAAVLGLLLPAAGRLCLRAPEGGMTVTAAMALFALTAAGEASLGPMFGWMVALHLLLVLLAMRAADPGRSVWKAMPRRSLAMGALVLVMTGALAVGLSLLLPPLSVWSQEQILGAGDPVSGFGERMWLGSMEGMLQSDALVLRVEEAEESGPGEGAALQHLRGVVYDRYEKGRWMNARPLEERFLAGAAGAAGAAGETGGAGAPDGAERMDGEGRSARVTLVAGNRDRYFLPLGARSVTPHDARARVDRFGVFRLPMGEATAVDFAVGGASGGREAEGREAEGRQAEGVPVGPEPQDLEVPAALRPELETIVEAWTGGAVAPGAKVEAIVDRLQTQFTYALSFSRRAGRDPLLDFLLRERRGHCEYFASAMVLLARTAGVPARMVVGYQVAERSPLGGYALVREQDAHAWAEVHLDGRGWTTVDATPSGGDAAGRETPLLVALKDWVAMQWGAGVRWLGEHPGTVLTAAGGLFVVALSWRMLRGRRRGRGRSAGRAVVEEPPPQELGELLAALARGGLGRGSTETLERFARRLEKAGRREAGEAIARYAALRYGGVGEAAAVREELREAAVKAAVKAGAVKAG